MSRGLNGFVVVLSVSVLGANLWLARPQASVAVAPTVSRSEVLAMPAPPQARTATPPRVEHPAASPFAYIHEDGREEYLPSGATFEDVHADAGFLGGHTYDSRRAVYHWSSAENGMPISASPSWP